MKSLCIIDDDPIFLLLTKRLIELNQYNGTVLDYGNGYDAYQAFKRKNESSENLPDIILLDINMPVWDGWDFLDEIIKLNIHTKFEIYIVSSSTSQQDIEKANSYPIKRFLTKPLKIDDFKSILYLY
jgi:CheY-like chemotaxis protein